jgi:hypothetical protein
MITIKDYYELLQRLVQKDFDRFGGNPHKWNRVLEFEEGQKLIKIIAYTDMGNEDRQRSAFGFIVKEDFSIKSTTKGNFFKRGDLLKVASWAAPAKNFARGNIFLLDENSYIRWTGIQ